MSQLKVNKRIIEVLDKISIPEIMLLRATGGKEQLNYLKGIYDAEQQRLHQVVITEPVRQSLVD